MKKSKLQNTSKKIFHRQRLIVGVLVVVITGGFFTTQLVTADQYEQQIQQLKAQNGQKEQQKQELQVTANTLEGVIAALQGQIGALEAQIRGNQTKSQELQAQIATAEKELDRQRDLLGQNIKAMYLEGQITTLEMLASSRDLSEFVDKEQYRNSVKSKIKTTLDKINALKLELEGKRQSLERVIADQQNMQGQLDLQRAEQARILGLNQAQRNELDGQIRSTNGQIAELRKQQAIENARLFGGGLVSTERCGTYPAKWCNAPMDTMIDSWGMYNRECVSWTAFKVAQSGRRMPYWGGKGNANQWDDNARAEGIPVDNNPREGDVAIWHIGYYGHTMYVEHVYGDGTILISQFNHDWQGTYSQARVKTSGLVFIHF